MKKIFSYALMMIATTVAFTSCEDDHDSNPVIETPTEFTINNPAVGDAVVDLDKSKTFNLTWSQPKFTSMDAPVSAHYQVQISPTGTFEREFDTGLTLDENKGCDYASIDETFTSCNADIPTKDIAKALQRVMRWEEDKVPATFEAKMRVRAFVSNASQEIVSQVVSSNTIGFKCAPTYVELKDIDAIMWYLVGNMFGAKWGSDIGVDALPMFKIPAYEYNKKTGAGEIEYINYFTSGEYNDKVECDASGFKIQRSDFNWDYSMNADITKEVKDRKGTIIYRNGDSKGDGGHILAPKAGYYKITLNTEKNEAKMEEYKVSKPQNYGVIQIIGSFNDWKSDVPMLPYNKEGVENHAWYYVMDVPAEGVQFKLRIAGSWDTNWGNATEGAKDGDVVGVCNTKKDGANIGLKKGKYVISFNDINGVISIVEVDTKKK